MSMRRPGNKRNKPPDNLPLSPILDNLGEAIEIIDVEWNVYYVNQAAADFGGKVAPEMRGKNVWETFPELIGSTLEAACRRAMLEQVHIGLEFYFVRCAKWFDIRLHPSPQYLTLYATEITRRVRAEAQVAHLAEIEALNARLLHTIEEANTMNEALVLSSVRQHELTEVAELLNSRLQRSMQEAHHRIKNNLQVIASLVEMQIGETDDNAHLKRINQHIHALASIHDLLTHQVKVITEADYIGTQAMLERLILMLQSTSGGRSIKAMIANVLLPTQRAASLCLFVSECVSNAIKHSTGEIEITLCVQGDQAYLEVCDDGKGFPSDFDWRAAAHTGLSLIDSTARYDLRGEVRYDNHPRGGGRIAITFPIPAITQVSETEDSTEPESNS